jgi:hypothetical protein
MIAKGIEVLLEVLLGGTKITASRTGDGAATASRTRGVALTALSPNE